MNHIFSTNVPNRMLIISDFSKDVLTVHVQFKFRDTSVMIRYLNSYLFVSTLLRIVSLYLNKQRKFQTLHSVTIKKKDQDKNIRQSYIQCIDSQTHIVHCLAVYYILRVLKKFQCNFLLYYNFTLLNVFRTSYNSGYLYNFISKCRWAVQTVPT